MNTPDEELAATETGSSTGPTRGTKRQHDESDEGDETENSQIHKRQRVDDEIISAGIQSEENLDEPSSSIEHHLDTTEPDSDQPALDSDETERTLTISRRVGDDPELEKDTPDTESHEGEANPTVLPPDPATEYTNQAEPNHTGEWEERDWTTLTTEELFSNPAWDYTLDPLFEPQPFDPAPWFPDDSLMICPKESDAESAGVQAEHSGGVEVLEDDPFSPDATFSSLFMDSHHNLESQTTEFTFLSSPGCAAPSVQGHQSPSSEQTSFQTSNSSAVFELELWRFTEASNDVGIGELHDDGPASNYLLQHLEPSAGQDGDEIQVKE
ncbi:hypothetical protein N0V85_005240 [Neurospora sp. IMI 360204]|nr:hypothetical protein N0V85_005240 [Neurospora sp. IMI 360204]